MNEAPIARVKPLQVQWPSRRSATGELGGAGGLCSFGQGGGVGGTGWRGSGEEVAILQDPIEGVQAHGHGGERNRHGEIAGAQTLGHLQREGGQLVIRAVRTVGTQDQGDHDALHEEHRVLKLERRVVVPAAATPSCNTADHRGDVEKFCVGER